MSWAPPFAAATVLTGGAYVAIGSIRRTAQAARMARMLNRAVDATDLSSDVNTIIRMGGHMLTIMLPALHGILHLTLDGFLMSLGHFIG